MDLEDKIKDSKKHYTDITPPNDIDTMILNTIKEKEKNMNRLNFKKWTAAAACTLVIFTGALNTSEAFASVMNDIPVISSISRVLTFRSYETKDIDKTLSVDQPKISDDDKNGYISKVNVQIDQVINDYTKQATADIAAYKEAFIATGGTEAQFGEKNIKVDVDYEIKSESEKILSLVLTANEDWSNAYGIQYFYNIDMENNKPITLSDLLGDDYINIANESIKVQMSERMNEDENLVYWGETDGYTGITETTSFYINSAGNPVVVFPKYEVAPGAYGPQEFEIK